MREVGVELCRSHVRFRVGYLERRDRVAANVGEAGDGVVREGCAVLSDGDRRRQRAHPDAEVAVVRERGRAHRLPARVRLAQMRLEVIVKLILI